MNDMTRTNLIFGVGLNDANYRLHEYEIIDGAKVQIWQCPFYRAWMNILVRCYSGNLHKSRPAYLDCEISNEWRAFSAFKDWMSGHRHEGKHLDKDILIPGNKIYGPDTCVFIDQALNAFITDRSACRGDFPIGVSWHKSSGKLQSRVKNPFTGKSEYLGLFTSKSEAHEAWRARKHELACVYADQQSDHRIAKALRARYINSQG